MELLGYLGEARPDAVVRAIPGQGTHVPVWILGSSLYGAQLAAHLGLPYAFASHFAPAALDQAAAIYRQTFRPSEQLDRPRFMLALNVFAAETDEEAKRLRTSHQLAVARLRTGRPGRLPRPVDDIESRIGPSILEVVNQALACSAVGSPKTVETTLRAFLARYEPDELILAGQIHDHAARVRSFAITGEILRALP
jgi:luciferase family oxidoreductase group 1